MHALLGAERIVQARSIEHCLQLGICCFSLVLLPPLTKGSQKKAASQNILAPLLTLLLSIDALHFSSNNKFLFGMGKVKDGEKKVLPKMADILLERSVAVNRGVTTAIIKNIAI